MLLQIFILSAVSLWALAENFRAEAAFYNREHSADMENLLPGVSRPGNHSYTFYGIMFDAGSTGTRIHVYTFIQKDPGEFPARAAPPGVCECARGPPPLRTRAFAAGHWLCGAKINMLCKDQRQGRGICSCSLLRVASGCERVFLVICETILEFYWEITQMLLDVGDLVSLLGKLLSQVSWERWAEAVGEFLLTYLLLTCRISNLTTWFPFNVNHSTLKDRYRDSFWESVEFIHCNAVIVLLHVKLSF